MDFFSNIPKHITIVAVTKNQSPRTILNLPKQITNIAENKVQLAIEKFEELDQYRKFTKHFIGHLQTNKVKLAVRYFDIIQTVDSYKLAHKISFEARKRDRTAEIFIQINASDDPDKYGFSIEEAIEAFKEIKSLPNLKVTGLMTILKDYDNPNLIKNDYLKMQNLFNQINNSILKTEKLKHLSMGMSQDYLTAIQAGSNMVRLGTLFFPNK